MALLTCPYCGKYLQHNVAACPWCHSVAPAGGWKKSYTPGELKLSGWALVIFVGFMLWLFLVSGRQKPTTAPAAPTPAVQNSPWDGSVYQVERFLDKNLKDPDSYQAIEWGNVVGTDTGFIVRVKFRAKNSFGGYEVAHKLFSLDKSGAVTSASDIE